MNIMSYNLEEAKYNLVEHDDHASPECPEAKSPSRKRTAVHVVQIIALFALAFVLGFVVGKAQMRPPQSRDGLLLPAGTVHMTFYQNGTFTQRPDTEEDRAWDDLVPVGRGFVQHPQLAPDVSALTVFHQLHCLHAILAAYYAAIEAANPTLRPHLKADADDPLLNNTGILMEPSHVRHCFDYLRQTIMCAADTNIEVLDRDTRATDGWGEQRVCRDYQKVFEWADKWAHPLDRSQASKS